MAIASYWWNRVRNFGDQLAPFIIERLTGREVHWTKTKSPRLLTVGSILTHAVPNDVVWGAGTMENNPVIAMPLDIRMVRGPLTAKYLADHYSVHVNILGDPAILLPEYYHPNVSKCPGVTVIPHYVDRNRYEGDRILDVDMNIFRLIDEIASSEMIITSSLHPLIVAESYGIPAIAVKNNSDPTWYEAQQWKFRDYYESTGRRDYSLDHPDYSECLRKIVDIPKPVFPDVRRMIEAFPWDRLDELMMKDDEV